MSNSKRGMIAPYQFFFIIFTSRIVVTLTYIQTVSVGKMSTDLLISIVVAYALSILFSLPIYYCIKYNKNPLKYKWIAILYALYFVFNSSINISRFSYFASTKLNNNSGSVFFIIIICIAVCYGAIMSIEALGRFSLFSGAVLIVAIITVVACNIKNFEMINLYPVIKNSNYDIIYNSMIFGANTVECSMFLALSDRINKNGARAYFAGLTSAFATIFVLVLFCMGTMGASAGLQSYPIFTLFQLASATTASRLDIIHTSFWIFAVFLKTSVLIYCACIMIKKYTHRTKAVVASVATGALAIFMNQVVSMFMAEISKPLVLATTLVFCIAIPLGSLVFVKKSKGDELLEKF